MGSAKQSRRSAHRPAHGLYWPTFSKRKASKRRVKLQQLVSIVASIILTSAIPILIVAFAADVQRNGSIDGLVNNAAIATNVGGMAFEDIDIDLWDRVMRVNVRGTWLVTSASSPFFNKGAQIVNLTSLYGDLHDFWRTSPSKVPSSR